MYECVLCVHVGNSRALAGSRKPRKNYVLSAKVVMVGQLRPLLSIILILQHRDIQSKSSSCWLPGKSENKCLYGHLC